MENLTLPLQDLKICIQRSFIISALWFILFSSIQTTPAQAQKFSFEVQTTIPLLQQADTLPNAWAGGINSGQYSTIHLNNDTVEDLVVFDRYTNTLSTFLAIEKKGTYYYLHSLSYEEQFPDDLQGWVLLTDYNSDGKKDIFTYSKLGVKVYQNISTSSSLAWKPVADPIVTQGTSGMINLQINKSDIPAITDLDNDGDLDILTYDVAGNWVEYHQNQSMDNYHHADSLVFKRVNTCWGKFQQGSSCGEYQFDIDCGSVIGKINSSMRIEHAGGYSLLVLDLDGDGDKDLLTGHSECTSVAKLTNHGTALLTRFTEANETYPANKPIFFPQFPAVFYEDLDFDGVKDLMATPNVEINTFDLFDFKRSNWLYKNKGTNESPVFDFVQKDFLQSTMLDVGENAFPALADYDADGDLDLFIGNRGNYDSNNGKTYATIYLYENIGTPQKAAFKFITEDYLHLSSLQLTSIKPYFADVNGDTITDLTFTNNSYQTDVKYIINAAPATQAFQFSIDAIQTLPLMLNADDTPLLYDLDGDHDLDVLVNKSSGNLEYYENSTTSHIPVYTLQSRVIEISSNESFKPYLILSIADFDGNGKVDLMTADQSGRLTMYPDLQDKLQHSPVKLESADVSFQKSGGSYAASPLKGLLFPTAADVDGDNLPELLIGTQAGGIVILQNRTDSAIPNGLEETGESYIIYPNPTKGNIHVSLPGNGELSVCSLLGQQVIPTQQVLANQEQSISLEHLPAGVYLVKVIFGKETKVKKIVLYK